MLEPSVAGASGLKVTDDKHGTRVAPDSTREAEGHRLQIKPFFVCKTGAASTVKCNQYGSRIEAFTISEPNKHFNQLHFT